MQTERLYNIVSNLIVYILAFALAIGLGALIIWGFLGINPFYSLSLIMTTALLSYNGLLSTVLYLVPLTLIGLGLAICYKARFWNIGADGQMIFGAIFTMGMALFMTRYTYSSLVVPLLLVMGIIGGAAYGLIPAILKVKFKVSEVLSSLMLNFVAIYLMTWLVDVTGPWKDPSSAELQSYPLPHTYFLPYEYISLLAITVVAIIIISYLYHRTSFGYKLKVMSSSFQAADYAGINKERQFIMIGAISGGLAGLAGALQILAIDHLLASTFDGIFFGYLGIFVAWLAATNPVYIIFAGLLMGTLINGGYFMQAISGVSVEFVYYFEGVVFISIIVFQLIKPKLRRLLKID
ncbi:MAG: ABC transporter permease [Nitrososphaerota archaeon]|nr:ABC transporter permease [Nitrososphaerota archaeon]MDG7051836.1 ABC transporter permease [Nitrososphaerota archaeon]